MIVTAIRFREWLRQHQRGRRLVAMDLDRNLDVGPVTVSSRRNVEDWLSGGIVFTHPLARDSNL